MSFTYLEDGEGKYRLLNLAQVRLIDEIEDGHCRIVVSPDFSFEIHGEGANILIGRLLAEAELLDGTPLANAVDKFRSSNLGGPKVQPIRREDESE